MCSWGSLSSNLRWIKTKLRTRSYASSRRTDWGPFCNASNSSKYKSSCVKTLASHFKKEYSIYTQQGAQEEKMDQGKKSQMKYAINLWYLTLITNLFLKPPNTFVYLFNSCMGFPTGIFICVLYFFHTIVSKKIITIFTLSLPSS